MKENVARDLESICRRYGVIAVFAFGSRGEEIAGLVLGREAQPGPADSDVDLGILLPRGEEIDSRSLVRLTADLEDAFGVGRIDLVVLGCASAFLAAEAVQGELIMDLSGRETAEFELFTLRRAGDLTRHRKTRVDSVLGEGAR